MSCGSIIIAIKAALNLRGIVRTIIRAAVPISDYENKNQ